jgi:dUTP pyrophosphatase
LKIKFKKLFDDVITPTYETIGSVGFDLRSYEDYEIEPLELGLVRTGLVIETPPGFMLALVPRSSTFKRTGLVMPHSVGVIDQDYSGEEDELILQFYNSSRHATVDVRKGDRIAQGIFLRIGRFGFEETESMGDSRGGFGSTGTQ